MIVFDLETTGLLKPDVVPLAQQPRIIEICVVKLDDETLEFVDSDEFLINPGIKLDPKIVEITGITDKMLEKEPPFVARYRTLANFFLGEKKLLAHNCPFDAGVLSCDLRRIEKQFHFPWPPDRLCSVELTQHITGKYMKLDALYKHAFGKAPSPTRHRAGGDVEILVEVVRWMRTQKLL